MAAQADGYQNVKIAGIDQGKYDEHKGSAFFNEGKWDNFIAPLLPKDCREMTFVEIGCNAGLYLKLATEWGFRNVWGIESNRSAYKTAARYRDELGMSYRLLHASVDEHFDFNPLPVADVVLLANVHYHMTLPAFVHLLDALSYKACKCLVVSIDKKVHGHSGVHAKVDEVRRYFDDWREMGIIRDISSEGDPKPRAMYSILFESDLRRVPISSLRMRDGRPRAAADEKYDTKVSRDFIGKVLERGRIDVRRTRYYKREVRRGMTDAKTLQVVKGKRDMILDMQRDGMKTPLLVDRNGILLDGSHRQMVLRMLGYETAIVRVL